jgi:hypothetical protein
VNELKAHQPKRKKGATDQTEPPAPPKRSLPWSKRGPGPGDRRHDGRDQQREKTDTDNIFRLHISPLHTTFTRLADRLSLWTEVRQNKLIRICDEKVRIPAL